jgi:hypothetical protein
MSVHRAPGRPLGYLKYCAHPNTSEGDDETARVLMSIQSADEIGEETPWRRSGSGLRRQATEALHHLLPAEEAPGTLHRDKVEVLAAERN